MSEKETLKTKRESKKNVSRAKYKPKEDTSKVQKRAKKYFNILTAQRNIRKIEKKTLLNKARKSKMKTSIRKLMDLINEKEKQDLIKNAFKVAQSNIMKTAKYNLIKQNKASRMISNLNARVKKLCIQN